MNGTVPLIVRRVRLGSLRSRTPQVEVLYRDKAGTLVNLAGRPLKWRQRISPRRRTVYEVDVRYHRCVFDVGERDLPARGGADFFDATVDVVFQVEDSVKVVQQEVSDGLAFVRSHVVNAVRQITPLYPVAESVWAEHVANSRLGNIGKLAEGIAIHACRVRLRPGTTFADHVSAMAEADRRALLNEKTHRLHVADAELKAQIEDISESAKIEVQARAIHALGNQKLSPRQLIGLYLHNHPKDGEHALELLLQYEQSRGARQDALDEKWLELLRHVLDKELIMPRDVGWFGDVAMRRLWGRAVSEYVRENADVVLPVYLVVDESDETALHDLNAGMTSLQSALLGETDAASAIRLCVIGFAGDVQVRMEPRALARKGPVRAFKTHRGGGLAGAANYGPAFRTLFERLPRDVGKLWSEGLRVHRPVVFFLTAQSPTVGSSWHDSHAQLVDRRTRWYAPHIVVYGIDTADRADVGRIATQPDFAFFARGDRAPAIRNAFTAIQRSVVKSGHAFSENRITMIISRPRDFDLAL